MSDSRRRCSERDPTVTVVAPRRCSESWTLNGVQGLAVGQTLPSHLSKEYPTESRHRMSNWPANSGASRRLTALRIGDEIALPKGWTS